MRRRARKSWSFLGSMNRLFAGKPAVRERDGERRRQRRVLFERLEDRSLLAATDLAAIAGLVFDDATGNGFDPGEEVAGATINLYQDDGDGVFEPGAGDTLVDTVLTDANGEYRFDDLEAGGYFVHQPNQTVGSVTLMEAVSSLISFDATDVMGVPVDTIDSFDTTTQSATASSMGSTTDASSVSAPEAIGGERDLFVELTTPTGQLVLDVNGLTPGLLEFQASSTALGNRIITWDGPDGDATTLDATGLGGVDLTAGGTASALSFSIGADQPNGQMTVRIYSDATNFSTATIAIPNTGGTAVDTIVVRFSDFTVGGGTGADFSNVGAIEVAIEGVAAVDGQLDVIETFGPTVVTQNFDNVNIADLSLTKTVSDETPIVGDDITFTITVSNAGPEDATGVVIEDVLPDGLTFVSANASDGTYDQATGLWTLGALANGADATLTIVARVDGTTAITNTAEIVAADQVDPDSTPDNNDPEEDDQDSVQVIPSGIDLSVEKTVNDATPNVGQDVTFTITVTNGGPNDATGVELTDVLPAGLTFVSANPSEGTYDEATGVWTIGAIPASSSETLTIVATVETVGAKTNTAEITAADQVDIDSTPNNNNPDEDDQASVTITTAAIDLSLTKTVNNSTPNVGDNVTFTITVTNSGPDDATGVAVTDVLPSGLTFVSANASQGSYASGTGIWTVGNIDNGENATLTIVATVTTIGAKTNTAEVTAADQADPDSTPGNNNPDEDDQASVVVTPQQIDLSLTKTVDNATPAVGDNVTFTITVSNAGPDDATGVVVTDLLPTGLTFVSADESVGTYVSGTGVWTIGELDSGASATLTIVATVASSGSKVNTAEVTAADQADPDSTPGNNNPDEDDQASVTVTPGAIDLQLSKTVNSTTPTVGSNVTFTITVSNSGPANATGVTVQDVLPTGLTFVSSTASTGSYSAATGLWTVGNLNSGASATLQIVATVTGTTAITNSAEVADADQEDADSTPGNNDPSEDDFDSVQLTPRRGLSKRQFLAR